VSAHTLHLGDCIDVMRAMPDNSVDAIVTDPPYHLTTGKKDGSGPASDNPDSPAGRARVGTGFMGMAWDGGDIAQSVDMWREALRVLKPGGHLLAFSGSRTYHRMACAIEDAGFEIRDQIMWVYGSGFPKSLDVSKAIDKAAGAEREVLGVADSRGSLKSPAFNTSWRGAEGRDDIRDLSKKNITAPATDAARQWGGWGTALKPSHEPICVARKPLVGTVAVNVQAWGTGALNIDGCRVPVTDAGYARNCAGDRGHAENRKRDMAFGMTAGSAHEQGRWPANLIHDGSDEVVALFPAEAGAAAPVHKRGGDKFRNSYGSFAGNIDEAGSTFRGDAGSAARFFYCAKASRKDRNEGCEAMAKKPLLWSSGTQNPGSFQAEGTDKSSQNHHPTVKPVSLMQYLVRLVTPPGGTVFDPFMGSGSTGKACMREGFRFVGAELNPEYLAIAEARIAHAAQAAARAAPPVVSPQIDLFEQASGKQLDLLGEVDDIHACSSAYGLCE
jgi:site-specific DNA-methyltransferase (adenine-specific)